MPDETTRGPLLADTEDVYRAIQVIGERLERPGLEDGRAIVDQGEDAYRGIPGPDQLGQLGGHLDELRALLVGVEDPVTPASRERLGHRVMDRHRAKQLLDGLGLRGPRAVGRQQDVFPQLGRLGHG
jgi:hypothetical protein